MNAAQLLEFLVSTPSVSGNEGKIANDLSGILSREGFRIQREGNSIWYTLGKRQTTPSAPTQPSRYRAALRGLE